MRPALRSNVSALGFLSLLVLLLLSPVLVSWIGLPPRSEAYKSISTSAGTAGLVVQAIEHSPPQSDIVFLGSSIVTAGISQSTLRAALSAHLHREPNVQVLAMNWPGLDVQYFMLRDYLEAHRARLIVWNLPEPHERAYEYPHIQAYRWIRYAEYSDALEGLAWNSRVALYGEMVIGAPRQFLSRLRPNQTGEEGKELPLVLAHSGYKGTSFIQDDLRPVSRSNFAQLLPLNSPELEIEGPAPGPYQMHFARLIVGLAKSHNCHMVLLHVPLDTEFQHSSIPELADWENELGRGLSMIAVPSSELFGNMDRAHFDHFYRDAHLNENGSLYYTVSILPALEQAYDGRSFEPKMRRTVE